ncbi:hypothetical protein M8C21_012799 [Ambrosia artemisiifolia]|uniref:Uncharacterized protein n=1 Tax=Ambrosia artemisiifolia TaxID=4212 RepID=A0AAD5D570_AMBAR|nr:hypothetical protein M8C21_012799 [Ambrosia artemisiifolia]
MEKQYLRGLKKEDKSTKELKPFAKGNKKGTLAALAVLGYFIQGMNTGVGPLQNLLDNLANA